LKDKYPCQYSNESICIEKPEDALTPEMRATSKAVNLELVYG